MSLDWARLATAIRRARESRRTPDGSHMTQQQLAVAASVSESTIQNLEDPAHTYTRRPTTLPRVEAALGWMPGSVDAILVGGEPTLLAETAAASPAAGSRDAAPGGQMLPLRVQHALDEGDLLDTEVLELSSGGVRMVVVVKRDPSRTTEDKEQIARDLAEWSRVQRDLRGIVSRKESGEPSDS
jgi:hypothetical protein